MRVYIYSYKMRELVREREKRNEYDLIGGCNYNM